MIRRTRRWIITLLFESDERSIENSRGHLVGCLSLLTVTAVVDADVESFFFLLLLLYNVAIKQ